MQTQPYPADGPNAEFFAPAVENTADLVVPTVSIYDVFQRVLQQRDEGEALQAVAVMQQGRVVDLDAAIALSAAKVSVRLKLPIANSVMLAAARMHDATLWTQDADFKDIEGVEYVETR